MWYFYDDQRLIRLRLNMRMDLGRPGWDWHKLGRGRDHDFEGTNCTVMSSKADATNENHN